MSLEDFDKVLEFDESDETPKNSEVEEKEEVNDDVEFKELDYYINNLDELFLKVRNCKTDYVKAKITYKKKEAKFNRDIDWGEVNVLRVDEGLPKITNKDGRDSEIFLRTVNEYSDMHYLKRDYDYYKSLLDFIIENYQMLTTVF